MEDQREDYQNNKKELAVKSVQIAMLLILLGAAFWLPGYGLQRANDHAVNSASYVSDMKRDKTIVIDAGHGGSDPGMVGASGIKEKDLNLVYAKKLQKLLEKDGYHVVQTRTDENGLYDEEQTHKKAQDMQKRVAVIAEEKPILTVSIHQNSYPEPSVCGPQVFYYEQSTEGAALATSIQNRLNEELQISRPRSAKGNTTYYILKRSPGTAVIVECGFLSNPEEEKKLQEEPYQEQVVQAIRDGIIQYMEALDN